MAPQAPMELLFSSTMARLKSAQTVDIFNKPSRILPVSTDQCTRAVEAKKEWHQTHRSEYSNPPGSWPTTSDWSLPITSGRPRAIRDHQGNSSPPQTVLSQLMDSSETKT
ncbi:phosphoribosylglycinamide formyltransferase [Sesbania bispinosa]|nr:phosphoribosylglycinamide formyltransferase [Sesbania bispinosa]